MARTFVHTHLIPLLPDIIEKKLYKDFKSNLQEVAQEKLALTPVYRLIKEEGPDHAKSFTVGAYLGDDLAGQGAGSSKQAAEQAAAESAIKNKGW